MGVWGHAPCGNFGLFEQLHFVRFEGRYRENQTVKMKRKNINAYEKFLVRNGFCA